MQHFAFPHRARCGSYCCSRRMPGIAPTGYQAIRLVDRHRLRDFVPWTAAGRPPRDFGGKNISGSLQYIKKAPRRSIVGGGGHPPGGHPIPLGERDSPTAWGLQRIPNTFSLSDRVLKTSHRIARALLTHVQKAPGPSRTKASPTPTCSTKFIGTSWRGGFPEWNHKTIAASAAPGAVTAQAPCRLSVFGALCRKSLQREH